MKCCEYGPRAICYRGKTPAYYFEASSRKKILLNNWHQEWARSLNGNTFLRRYNKICKEISVSLIRYEKSNSQKISFTFWYQDYKNFVFWMWTILKWRNLKFVLFWLQNNFPKNIDLTSICTHKSRDLHNVILNFVSLWLQKHWFHIVHLEINGCKSRA
jgi:hypothetical protein